MTSVAVFTGTRADLNPLLPVIKGLHDSDEFELTLLTGPGHDEAALRVDLRADGMTSIPRLVAVAPPTEVVDAAVETELGAGMVAATADALAGIEVLVVLGDRWELLFVVPAAVVLGVRVVHLHGGEVTTGAVDDRIRHAMTKLADQHCVASADAAARVASLGEDPARIHLTGAPGLDRLGGVRPLDEEEFEQEFGQPLVRPLALFTYHPPTAVTADPDVLRTWVQEALDATMDACPTVIATYPGMDTGHDEIRATIDDSQRRRSDLVVRASLGPLYPRLLATADVMVGNSSSGIVEAATFALPVVDVGERQSGRLRGANVVTVPEGGAHVRAALHDVLAPTFRTGLASMANPYGSGQAARAVLAVVAEAADGDLAKAFVDVEDREVVRAKRSERTPTP